MRKALEEFLRVMPEEIKHDMTVEEHPVHVPVSDVVADPCQIISTNCYVKPSNAQHHNVNPNLSTPFGIMLPCIFL